MSTAYEAQHFVARRVETVKRGVLGHTRGVSDLGHGHALELVEREHLALFFRESRERVFHERQGLTLFGSALLGGLRGLIGHGIAHELPPMVSLAAHAHGDSYRDAVDPAANVGAGFELA